MKLLFLSASVLKTDSPFIAGGITGGISEKCVTNFSDRVYVVHSIQRFFKFSRKTLRDVGYVVDESTSFCE